ncbi:hypothetical protein SAMN04489712_101298 [Thermomonospora echinospora]|uniref:Uncharacterized protein n=1 Tax=Thermomonospora echinospora TaxID=1992 RepID=A0A1H5SP84_9ACTN|nr:DUF6882 domain-containing protein [Thermomonospora echinospora]SEF52244.1 hypothetical protein SAMN04489712_101298 [Thermomonospora echinospora]
MSGPTTTQAGFSPAFQRLGAALAAVVLQQQETLAEFLPREDWNADLTARTYSSGGVTVRVSLLGSYAVREQTWLWGWANPQFGEGHPAVAPTLVVREIGERLGVPELVTPEVDLSWYDGPAGHGGELVAMVAGGILGGGGYIGAGYDGGSAYLHVDDPQTPRAGWDPIPVPRLVLNAAGLFPHDPRLTLARFLSHHRVPYRETSASIEARTPGGGSARARFDSRGRLTDWQSSAGGEAFTEA